jgi:predicted SAM-dependent methyltransferase/2-polyprenyl-3-methyl-5-hydroxy-6-metoxy-1,4-benzoquinol methylase
LDNLVNDAFFDSDIRVSYLFHVIRNQWYLNDFLNPLIVRELVNSRGRCIPYDLRKKLGLEQCVCHISQRATVVAEPRDHLPHTDIRSAATKNWAFDSGERQTAGRLEDIRKDHLNRYQYVADFIKSTSSDTGTIGVLDVFCGNGYGSFLFTNEIEGVVVDAIDGSAEAIEFAKQNFSSEKITYHNAIFPFSSTVPIRPEYDYIVSFESIEHVEDDRRFYEFLLSKLKDNGVLFLSFPNKRKIDLSKNTNLFHFRHYDLQDIESLIQRGSRRVEILQSWGQDVYVLDKDGCNRGLLNESDMVLERNYEGQFLMVALRKLSRNQAGDERYVNLQKLDVGCGPKKPMPGFVGVDTRPFPWVKYVCDAWKIDKHVPPDSISEIYSRHFFEHLTFAQADLTLQAWNQILVPGGMLRIIVPDIEYHIKQFLTPNSLAPSETNPKWTVLEHALAGFWGWQNEGEEKFWDVHKSGYDFRCLEMKLLQHGFSDIRRIDDKPWNLNVICKTDIAKQMGENEL